MRLLQLGKIGDVLSILPILFEEYKNSGEKQELIISEQFASILDGISYIEPLIWYGEWTDIVGASDWFGGKSLTTQVVGDPKVIISQVYGKSPYQINKNTDSFVKEMWRLAGKLDLWTKQPPLYFDQRDLGREEKLVKEAFKKVPVGVLGTIIVADNGISSPFPHRRLLRELVSKRWPGRVLYMDEIVAEKFYDLIGILEHDWVQAIIATDSAILHLAHTCQKPVIALITDKPSLWHGAPWRPSYKRYIRYGNFPRDCVEMLDAIDNINHSRK